jgi:hypothetical protein
MDYYPPKNDSVSDKIYSEFIICLKETYPKLKNKYKYFYPTNLVLSHCQLKSPKEVIWNSILYSLKIDSIRNCKLDFVLPYRNKLIRSSLTPKQYFDYKNICDCVFKRIDTLLIRELIKIQERDDRIREHHTYEEIRTNKKLQDEMVQLDTINMRHIDDILLRYGRYPGKKLVDELSDVVALVIQHSPYANQKKYLPYIEKAVYDHDLSSDYLAVMTDRILMIENKPQLYGSQIIYDEKRKKDKLYMYQGTIHDVEKRRESLCLISLKNYLKYYYPHIEYPNK